MALLKSGTRIYGTATVDTQVLISGTATSNSTQTGALQVVGGVGIGRGLVVGGTVTATNFILNGYQVSTGSGATFTGGSVANATTFASTVTITNTAGSNSTNTGALQVVGGVGVAGSVFVGGVVTATTFIGALTGTASAATTATSAAIAYSLGNTATTHVGRATTADSATTATSAAIAYSLGNTSTTKVGLAGTADNATTATSAAIAYSLGNTSTTRVGFSDTANNISAYTINQNVGTTNSPTFAGLTVNGTISATQLTIQLTTITTTLVQTDDVIQTLNTTTATSTQTGALIVAGGAGFGDSVYIGNKLYITSPGGPNPNFVMQGDGEQTFRFYNTSTVSTASTRVSWKMASRNNPDWNWIMYTDVAGNGTEDWLMQNRVGPVIYANTLSNVGIGTTSVTSKLTVGGSVTISGVTTVTNTTAAISTSTGALQVAGGAGIGGALWASNAVFTKSATTGTPALYLSGSPLATSTNTGLLQVGAPVNFTDSNIIGSFVNSVNAYTQLILQNQSAGNSASADFIVNNDRTSGGSLFGDFGINSSGFTGAGGPFDDADGTYLYAAGGTLSVGTTDSKDFRIGTNNTTRITVNSSTGAMSILSTTASTSTSTGALTVAGGVGIGGNLWIGGTIFAASLRADASTSGTTFAVYYNPVTDELTTATITASGGGVTSITAGTGLTGGTITSSGTIAINTSVVVTLSDAQTITNKRVTSRALNNGATTTGSITPTSDTADQFDMIGLTGSITVLAPSGTPTHGQRLVLRIKDNGTARTIAWTTSSGGYKVIGTILPTTTIVNKETYVGCIYNTSTSYWDVIGVTTEV